jgi:hypothetical protein
MSAAVAPGPAPRVDQPRHPLHALTTFELRGYRRQLENAVAFFDAQDPVPPVRDELQAKLHDVAAEQDERTRLARAGPRRDRADRPSTARTRDPQLPGRRIPRPAEPSRSQEPGDWNHRGSLHPLYGEQRSTIMKLGGFSAG